MSSTTTTINFYLDGRLGTEFPEDVETVTWEGGNEVTALPFLPDSQVCVSTIIQLIELIVSTE